MTDSVGEDIEAPALLQPNEHNVYQFHSDSILLIIERLHLVQRQVFKPFREDLPHILSRKESVITVSPRQIRRTQSLDLTAIAAVQSHADSPLQVQSARSHARATRHPSLSMSPVALKPASPPLSRNSSAAKYEEQQPETD